jgi:hypothetical protein
MVQKLGWEPEDQLTVSTFANDTVMVLRRAKYGKTGRNGVAGQMGNVWGDHEENMRYLAEERASWDESVLASAPDDNR